MASTKEMIVAVEEGEDTEEWEATEEGTGMVGAAVVVTPGIAAAAAGAGLTIATRIATATFARGSPRGSTREMIVAVDTEEGETTR